MYGEDEIQDGKKSSKKCGLFAVTALENLLYRGHVLYLGEHLVAWTLCLDPCNYFVILCHGWHCWPALRSGFSSAK